MCNANEQAQYVVNPVKLNAQLIQYVSQHVTKMANTRHKRPNPSYILSLKFLKKILARQLCNPAQEWLTVAYGSLVILIIVDHFCWSTTFLFPNFLQSTPVLPTRHPPVYRIRSGTTVHFPGVEVLSAIQYHPPLLPEQEHDLAVPSAQHYVCRCWSIWRETKGTLMINAECNRHIADRRRIQAPAYCPRDQVWLSTQNIPLKAETQKLCPKFLAPFVLEMVINPVAMRLCLPHSFHIHLVFNVS